MSSQFAPSTAISHLPRHERLLSASASASRVLLEAEDVMAVMLDVLRELGEAAGVDRTALSLVESDAAGARWLMLKREWIAPHRSGERSSEGSRTERLAWDEAQTDGPCERLRRGQTVYIDHRDSEHHRLCGLASSGVKTSVIVPFLVDGTYAGAIGFEHCRVARSFDTDAVSALEIAASVVGAALHRDRLVAAVRAEREQAAERRVTELARANAALRSNLEWLAGATEPGGFFGHMLLETVRQFDATEGTLLTLDGLDEGWHVTSHVRGGAIEAAPFANAIPISPEARAFFEHASRQPAHHLMEGTEGLICPDMRSHLEREGHQALYWLPLVFGERNVGLVILAFSHRRPLRTEQELLLVALGQQMTLAVAFKRLSVSARNAAVLAERNRIGQEIHDGLAQAFVGILMQLGAAEEGLQANQLPSVLARIRDIARDGLSEARRSVLALKPTEPRAGGLEFALRQLAARSTVPGRVTCLFEGGANAIRLAPENEHELLRIAQEAVSNAVRHAQPRLVRITLDAGDDQLHLRIEDDGCGMRELPEHHAQHGFGLSNMRERAQAIGGTWQITSRPGEGTRIDVRVPKVPA